jgi:hypothetical protein
MQPDISSLMFAWYVWGVIFVGTAVMTVVGTLLITRGWKE